MPRPVRYSPPAETSYFSRDNLAWMRAWNAIWISGALILGLVLVVTSLRRSISVRNYHVAKELYLGTTGGVVSESDRTRTISREELDDLNLLMLCGAFSLGMSAYGIGLWKGYTITLRSALMGLLAIGALGTLPTLLQKDPKGLRTCLILRPISRFSTQSLRSAADAIEAVAEIRSIGQGSSLLGPPDRSWFSSVQAYVTEDANGACIVCVFEPDTALPWSQRRALSEFFRAYAMVTLQRTLNPDSLIDPTIFQEYAHGSWLLVREAWEAAVLREQIGEAKLNEIGRSAWPGLGLKNEMPLRSVGIDGAH